MCRIRVCDKGVKLHVVGVLDVSRCNLDIGGVLYRMESNVSFFQKELRTYLGCTYLPRYQENPRCLDFRLQQRPLWRQDFEPREPF